MVVRSLQVSIADRAVTETKGVEGTVGGGRCLKSSHVGQAPLIYGQKVMKKTVKHFLQEEKSVLIDEHRSRAIGFLINTASRKRHLEQMRLNPAANRAKST